MLVCVCTRCFRVVQPWALLGNGEGGDLVQARGLLALCQHVTKELLQQNHSQILIKPVQSVQQ